MKLVARVRYVLAVMLLSLQTIATNAAEPLRIQDPVTGVAVTLPVEAVGRVKQSTLGVNWRSRDGQLNIDTLKFPPERPLGDILATLKAFPGRVITKEILSHQGLLLEGVDVGRERFIVKLEVKGDGTKRGVSVVFGVKAARRYSAAAQSIAASMRVAGGSTSTVAESPPAAQRFATPQTCRLGDTRTLALCAPMSPAHAYCDRERPALVERGKLFQMTLPSQQEIELGDSVEISSLSEPQSGKLGPQRNIYAHVDMPADAEILDAKGQPLRVPAYDSDAKSPHARPTLDGEPRKRFSLGHVTYADGIGKLRIRPTKAGPLKLFAQIEVAPFSGRTYSLPDCPAILLSETAPVTINVKAPQPYGEPRSCHMTGRSGHVHKPVVHVGLSKATENVRFGEVAELHWDIAQPLSSACKTPLYLVLSMPERVRFSGDGFFALMPGAGGPFKISHDQHKVRVFVPLHIGAIAKSGSIGVKIYQAGDFKIDWSLVEIPVSTSIPTKLADFAREHPVVSQVPDGTLTVNVLPGHPSIVVQDRFTSDRPIRSLYSADGTFELQIFNTFYRVLDGQKGELILQRDGREPNFSSTARFLHALLENDTDIEVVDLYSRAPIFSGTRERAERTSSIGAVTAVAWGREDSFALLAAGGGGNAFLLNTLVDRAATAIDSGSRKASVASEVDLRIDLEAMTIINAPSPDNGWRDSTTHHSLLESQSDDSSWQPDSAPGKQQRGKRRYQRDYALFPLSKPHFTQTSYRWDLGEETRLSYPLYCGSCPPGWENMDAEELKTRFKPSPPDYLQSDADRRGWAEDQIRDMVAFRPMMVRHSSSRPKQRAGSPTPMARVPSQERSLMRKELTRGDAAAANESQRALTRVVAMTGLSFSSLRPTAAEGGKIAEYTMDGTGGTRMVAKNRDHQLEEALRSHAASPAYRRALQRFGHDNAAQYYRTGRLDVIWDSFSCAGGGVQDTIGQFIVPIRIEGRRSWQSGTTFISLIQQQCIPGNAPSTSMAQLGVLTFRERKGAQYIPLNVDLGLDSVTTWDRKALLKSWLTEDDVLLVAGSNRALFVYDVKTRKSIAHLSNAPEADLASALHLSADRSMLLQINENGRLFIYRLRDQKRLISGYYLDDELVLHQDDGYYMATPEGAHFIHLAFPGVDGHFSFRQFHKTLNRPDIIHDALFGTATAPDPRLGIPPTLQIEVTIPSSPDRPEVNLRYKAASFANLQRLLVYTDGRPVMERDLSERTSSGELSVPIGPEARWISAVAIDDRGHQSTPQTHALSGPRSPGGNLFAILAGTDTYDDPSIATLGAAKRDAKAFAEAILGSKGGTYRDVSVTPLLDERDLLRSLPERISEVVAAAGPSDTIMLYAAGHGIQGKDGKFYLVAPTTQRSSLETTALSWDVIAAALGKARARVVVFLDACRSGAAGGAGSNDEAVTSLLQNSSAMTIIAAAKGRQDSLETDSGGYFTSSLVKALNSRAATDSNSNGAIELAELYGIVKREVVAATSGQQTPWIARNHMVGEIPLF